MKIFALLLIFLSSPVFAQKTCSALFSNSTKPAITKKVDFKTRVEQAYVQLRNFHPEVLAPETTIRPEEIIWEPLADMAERGADGQVRFGTYQGKPIVAKFYYALSLQSRLESNAPEVLKKGIARFVNQSVAVMQAVHTLGFGPKPYGFALDQNAIHWFESAKIPTTALSAVVIMERVQHDYHKKSRYIQRNVEQTKELKLQIDQAITAFESIGLTIMDMDFMLVNNRLNFIDFDKWLIAKEDGFWWMGMPRADAPKPRDFRQEINEVFWGNNP